jgi:hypothetical protein
VELRDAEEHTWEDSVTFSTQNVMLRTACTSVTTKSEYRGSPVNACTACCFNLRKSCIEKTKDFEKFLDVMLRHFDGTTGYVGRRSVDHDGGVNYMVIVCLQKLAKVKIRYDWLLEAFAGSKVCNEVMLSAKTKNGERAWEFVLRMLPSLEEMAGSGEKMEFFSDMNGREDAFSLKVVDAVRSLVRQDLIVQSGMPKRRWKDMKDAALKLQEERTKLAEMEFILRVMDDEDEGVELDGYG